MEFPTQNSIRKATAPQQATATPSRSQSNPPSPPKADATGRKNTHHRLAAGGGASRQPVVLPGAQPPALHSMSLVPFAPAAASGLQALGQPCRIFADVSNVWSEIKRSGVPLRVFLDRVQTKDFCRLVARIAFGSKTPDFASRECAWETAFRSEGWQVRSELRPDDGRESMVDDSIAAHIYRAIIDHRGESIVVLSGDGNQRNHSQVSIFDAVLSAMKHNIRVVLWCWKQSRNEQYKRLQSAHPSLFSLNYLDECVPVRDQQSPPRPSHEVIAPPAIAPAGPSHEEALLLVSLNQAAAGLDRNDTLEAVRRVFGRVHFYTIHRPQCPGSKDILLSFKSTQHLADAAKIRAGELQLKSGALSITGTRFFYKSKPKSRTPSPPAPPALVYCRFFAAGHCKHGDACKHLHVIPPQAAPEALELSVPREVEEAKRDEKDDCEWLKELLGEIDPAVQAHAQGGSAQRSASICEDIMSLWSHSSTNEAGSEEHTAASLSSDSDSDASVHSGAFVSSSRSSMCAEFEECDGREEAGGGEASVAVLLASPSLESESSTATASPTLHLSSDSARHSAAISEACTRLEQTKPAASSPTTIRVLGGPSCPLVFEDSACRTPCEPFRCNKVIRQLGSCRYVPRYVPLA